MCWGYQSVTTLRASMFSYQRWHYINEIPIRPILSMPIPWLPIWHVCLRLSVIRFLPTEEGDYVRMLSVSPVGEGFNTPPQFNRWNVSLIITGVCCVDYVCALIWSMVAGWGGVLWNSLIDCALQPSNTPEIFLVWICLWPSKIACLWLFNSIGGCCHWWILLLWRCPSLLGWVAGRG